MCKWPLFAKGAVFLFSASIRAKKRQKYKMPIFSTLQKKVIIFSFFLQ